MLLIAGNFFSIGRPKTANSSQDSISTTGSAESGEKFRKSVNLLDPLCYEEEEDMQEDEVEDMVASNKPSGLGRDGSKRANQQQMLRRKFSSRRDNKTKPQPPPRFTLFSFNLLALPIQYFLGKSI